MSANRSNPPRMSVDEIEAAIDNPGGSPHQPEGGSDVTPLSPLGLDRQGPDLAPENVTAQQGAGGAGYLTPGAQGTADDGTLTGGTHSGHAYSSVGPEQRPTLSGVPSLTAGQVNTPSDGSANAALAGAAPGGPQLPLGDNQGQGINPALKVALSPRPGPFGDPSL